MDFKTEKGREEIERARGVTEEIERARGVIEEIERGYGNRERGREMRVRVFWSVSHPCQDLAGDACSL